MGRSAVLVGLTALLAAVALLSVIAGVRDPAEGKQIELIGRGVRARQGLAIASAQRPALSINEVGKADHLKFECDGEGPAHLCLEGVAQCIERNEKAMYELYKTSPREATELRPSYVCKCFQNNGCTPSCNVQMYLLWVTESKTQCPASPPSYDASAGVFDYSTGGGQHATSSDVSHDYFPNYPNPSGHRYYGPVPDYEYRMPDFYSHRYNMDPYTYYTAPRFAPPQQDAFHPLSHPSYYRYPASSYYYTQPPRAAFPSEANPWGGRYVEAGGDYNGAFDPYAARYAGYVPSYVQGGGGASVPAAQAAADDSWYHPYTSWLFH